tara:strand:+ start:2935 stop:10098 length:7164 start_codon:yes stop_codon:yes gene_type:complete
LQHQLSSIRITPYHEESDRKFDQEDLFGTHLQRSLLHWQELCCSSAFVTSSAKIFPKCSTLAQLILHREEIVDSLFTGVKSGDIHSLVAFFNAVASVAKDIGGDFVLYFRSTVQTMTFCLNNMELDANHIEAMFRTLASICMVLWRSERVMPIEILEITLEIRQHRKQYIRKFAAQAVAPILRSSRKTDLLRIIDYLLLECTCETLNFTTSWKHIFDAVTLMWHYMTVIPPNTLHSKSNIMLEVLFNPSFSAEHSKHIVLVHNVITSLDVTLPKSTGKSIWAPFLSVLDRFNIIDHSNIDDAAYCVKVFIALCTTKFEVPFGVAELPNFLYRYISWCLGEGGTVEQHTVAQLLGTISSRDECKTVLLVEPLTWSNIVQSFGTNSLTVMLNVLWRNLISGCVTAQNMCRALLIETAHIIVFQDFECSVLLANIIERIIVAQVHDDIQFAQLEPGIIDEYFERQWMDGGIDQIWATLRILPYFTGPATVHRTITELISKIESSNNNMSMNNYSITEATILMSALEAEEVCKRRSPSVDSAFTHNLINIVLRRELFLPGIWFQVKELVNHHHIDLSFAETLRRSNLTRYASDSNRFLRLSILRCLASTNEQHPNSQTILGITSDIVQLFCYVNEISSDSNDVLIRSRKCVNQIMNITRRLRIERDDSTNYVAMMHMALGALRVRFKPIWEPVIDLIGVIGECDEGALHVLEKGVLLVENELSGQKDVRKFANNCETSGIRREIHEALIPYEKSIDHYQHMEFLLEALIKCSKTDFNFSISIFHRLFALAKGYQRYIDKRYANIVVKMLKLIQINCFQNLDERKQDEVNVHGDFFDKIRVLAADENTEVALEALKSMSLQHLDYLSSNRLTQLSMLANPATVKRTLTSVTFERESQDNHFLPVLGQNRIEVVTLTVELVSKYIFSKKIASKPIKSLVLRWFASLKATEMEPFMKMLFFPFGNMGTGLVARAYSGVSVCEQHLIETMICSVPCHTLISFTMQLREVYQTIPEHMKTINSLLLCTSFQIFNFSCDGITEDQTVCTDYKSLRAVTLTLLACMVPTSSKEDLKLHWERSYSNLKLIAEGMANECVGENEPALLRVISSVVHCQNLDGFFDETSNHVFILNVTKMLRNPNISAVCRQAVLNIISCLVGNTACTSAPRVVATLFDDIAYSMQLSFMRSFELGNSTRTDPNVDTRTELHVLQRMAFYGRRHPWNTNIFERIVNVVCSKDLYEEKYNLLLDTICLVLDGLTLDEGLRISTMQKFAVLFLRKSSRTSRSKLLKIYALICSAHDRTISVTLNEMNSYVEQRIDEFDYGRRINIYNELRTKWSGETNMAKTLWIYNALHALHTGDLVLQNSAMAIIRECLKFDRAADSTTELHPCEHINIVLQEAVRLLKSRMGLVRECGVKILRYATLNHHLPQLRLLCADNEDKDVFLNLSHIQSHRRSRALRKLFASDTLQAMGSHTCMSYTVPLLLAFIRDASVDVAATAVDGLGQLSTHLTLSQFVIVVRGLLQRASSKDGTEHYYLRGAACMVDKYRTEHVFPQAYEDSIRCEKLILTVLPLAEARLHAARNDSTCSNTYLQINAVICASGLLSLLDDTTREQGLLQLLKMVNENLANRSQKLRDNALAALKSISSVLGERHLPLIIQSLKTGRATGFHLPVLGKAIYVVVSSCNGLLAEFASAVFTEIVMCLHSNIFISHRNEAVGKSSSLVHEAKSVYSLKTISILVASLRENDQFFKFVRTFIRKLPSVPTNCNQNHFGLILRAFREGISQNPHLNTTHVLYLAGSFIEEYVICMRISKVGAEKENTDISPEYVIKVHQFAVGLLCDCLKKISSSGATNDKLPSVGGIHNIVELMTRCLVSTSYDVQVGATRILNKILRNPSMCRDLPMDSLAKQIYRTLMTCKSVSDRLAQNCLRVLAHIIKLRSSPPFHSKKISLLLQFAFKNLAEDAMHLRVSFLLLNAMISRRMISEEMYTLLDDLLFMISQGQTAQLRHMCSHVVIRFILTYPIGERHMEKLLRNMVASLEYSNPGGRVSAISAIRGLVTRLPDTSIKFHGLTFYFPLVLRMVADDNSNCSKLASRAIDSLFLRLNTEQVEELLAFTDIWSSRKDRLRQAACQVLLIGFRTHAHSAFKCYTRNEDRMLDQMRQSLHNPCVDDWSWVYCLLSCFECANQYRREHLTKSLSNCSKLLDLLPSAVLYEHAWVQFASIRVLKSHLQVHHQWGDDVLTCVSIEQVSRLAQALVTNIECVRCDETLSAASTDELFYCLSKMFCTLSTQPGFERICVDCFTRIRKTALVSNAALRCSLLRMTAAMISASEAGARSTDAVLFHAVALCQICVEECVTDSSTTGVQSHSLAKDILSSVQQIMPPQEFVHALNRASLR